MSSRRSVRQVLVAVLLGVLVGGGLMAVTPAGAEVSSAVATNWKKIWKKNLRPLADKRYYTKKQSDAKYATKAESAAAAAAAQSAATNAANSATDSKLGSYYTKAQADAKYQPQRALQLGQWSMGAAAVGGQPLGAITFPEPVGAAPTVVILGVGAPSTLNCPGSAAAPDARAGFLCIYTNQVRNQTGMYSYNSRTWGAQIAADATGNADNFAWGSWALR